MKCCFLDDLLLFGLSFGGGNGIVSSFNNGGVLKLFIEAY